MREQAEFPPHTRRAIRTSCFGGVMRTAMLASQVALARASVQPGISSLLLGAKTAEQLQDNLESLEVDLGNEQLHMLEAASELAPAHPYLMQSAVVNRGLFGGATVQGWR
jgi:aryl-alcohol dehydrogenase-like predicted oxidoreductase